MRTLSEIIEEAKSGGKPAHEECYYALLAYEALMTMCQRSLMDAAHKEDRAPAFRKLLSEKMFNTYKGALDRPPRAWLGWNNDPANPEYQRRREIGLKLVDKFFATEES